MGEFGRGRVYIGQDEGEFGRWGVWTWASF